MTTGDPSGDFFDGFLDDYFAESDEHLTAIRRALLALEPTAGAPAPHALVEDLFRRFHSLKGISGMVELREAEVLAHHLESHLRAMRDGGAPLTREIVEALFDGTHALEQVVLARKANRRIPDVTAAVSRLEALLARDGTVVQDGPAGSRPPAPSDHRWAFRFTPAPELTARGVNVNEVRARLTALGPILLAVPQVTPEGTIQFEFVVGAEIDPARLEGWEADGLTWTRMPDAPLPVLPAEPPVGPASVDVDGTSSVAPSHFVRVDLTRLDDLMRVIGDLVISRARLDDSLNQVAHAVPAAAWRALQENNVAIERQLRELREGVMRVRLVPVGEVFRRMPFVVRDLAREWGKRIRLELEGQRTEIDKFLIERMMDPLLHLVRNAVSHGIEPPAERIAAGKPPEATIHLSATTIGEEVVIEVSDDGRGIDAGAVAARARAAGLPVDDDVPAPAALLALLCAPGFSTRDEADRASGRGVGMSVVKRTVEELGGTLTLDTAEGRGTTFALRLPLTLAIADAIIAAAGAQTFAVPQGTVREVIEVDPGAVRAIEQGEITPYRQGVLPLVRLCSIFGLTPRPRRMLHVFVVGSGRASVGIVVDRIIGQREIVVRSIADPLIRVEGISGATDLGDGRVVLILDLTAVARHARGQGGRAAPVPTTAG